MVNKNILIIIPSFDAGGVEKALINLANGLSTYANVRLLVCVNRGEFRKLVSRDVEIVDLHARKLKFSFFLLISYLLRNKYDYVISGPTFCNLFLILVKKVVFARFRLIITHHNYQDIEIKGWGMKGNITPMLIRNLYPYADKIIAVSNGIKNELVDSFHIDSKKIEVIYNAVIDKEFYKLANEDNAANIIGETRYLLFIGRLEKVKNCLLLINAFSDLEKEGQLTNIKLIIVGDGSEREELMNLSVKLNLENRIKFTGAIDNPLFLLKDADVLVNTSFSEALPIVLIEAMALNVKIIASNTPGAREVLKNYDKARFFPINDQSLLKEQIYSALRDNNQSESLISEKFDSGFIVDQYLRLFNSK